MWKMWKLAKYFENKAKIRFPYNKIERPSRELYKHISVSRKYIANTNIQILTTHRY